MRSAVGAVYQTRDPLVLQDPVPPLGVELGLVDHARHAVGERGDDAVGRAGHPAGVGGAPEHVVGVQVERRGPGGVVGDDGVVDVDGALRRAGGAAGEVQQRHVLGVGRRDLELVGGRGQQLVEADASRRRRRRRADEHDVVERRERVPQRRHLAAVERRAW